MKNTVTLKYKEEKIKSDDFVCVVSDAEKGAVLYYDTDALTLGMAIQLIAVAYKEQLAELSEEEQEKVTSALFIGNLED